MEVKKLKEDSYIKEWLKSINSKPNTEKNYLLALHFFTDYTNKTPEELITEAEQEIENNILPRKRNVKRYLLEFKDQLQKKELAPLTIRSHISAVKSFYKSFDIEIPNLGRNEHKALPLEKHSEIPSKIDIQ